MIIQIFGYFLALVIAGYTIVLPIQFLIKGGNYDSPYVQQDVTDMKKKKFAIYMMPILGLINIPFIFYECRIYPFSLIPHKGTSYILFMLLVIAGVRDIMRMRKNYYNVLPQYRRLTIFYAVLIAVSSLILLVSILIHNLSL